MLNIYVFVGFCAQVLRHSKDMHTEKNKIDENILEEFLFERVKTNLCSRTSWSSTGPRRRK